MLYRGRDPIGTCDSEALQERERGIVIYRNQTMHKVHGWAWVRLFLPIQTQSYWPLCWTEQFVMEQPASFRRAHWLLGEQIGRRGLRQGFSLPDAGGTTKMPVRQLQ
jgi:hypothetical protein